MILKIFQVPEGYLPTLTLITLTPSLSILIRQDSRINKHSLILKHKHLQETYLSADDLRINLWHMEITDQSFNIVDIKPANMEELTEVNTAAEFHPKECNLFVYSSSKGTIRLCDMRQVNVG